MALRTLISDGVEWAVWDVRPASPARLGLTGASPVLQSGWLCFESQEEKRRVAPIPAEWERWSDAELEACCRTAPRVQRRSVIVAAPLSL